MRAQPNDHGSAAPVATSPGGDSHNLTKRQMVVERAAQGVKWNPMLGPALAPDPPWLETETDGPTTAVGYAPCASMYSRGRELIRV